MGNSYIGCIKKEFTFFKPSFNIDFNGWHIDGSVVATVSKEIFNWTDTYVIDVANPSDALCALMLVLAIDAEKCSRNN